HQRLGHVTSAVLAEVALGVRKILSSDIAHAGKLVEQRERRKWESALLERDLQVASTRVAVRCDD
ncbi:MAG: hypothetical protein AAB370_04905, partial [Verrucomicrobiota bacterium]